MNSLLGQGIPYRPKTIIVMKNNKKNSVTAKTVSAPAPKPKASGKKKGKQAALATRGQPVKSSVRKSVGVTKPGGAKFLALMCPLHQNSPSFKVKGLAILRNAQHSFFDLRKRSDVKEMAIRFLNALARKIPAARYELQRITDSTSVSVSKSGPLKFTFVESPGDFNAGLNAGNSAHSVAEDMENMEGKKVEHLEKQLRTLMGNRAKQNSVARIEDEMIENEIESNAVGDAFLASLLEPCSASNIGVPDEENRALSAKLRVRTLMIAPVTSGRCFARVSRNPINHIYIEGSGGAGSLSGPTITNEAASASSRDWDTADSFLFSSDNYNTIAKSTTVKIAYGYTGGAWEGEDIGYHRSGLHGPRMDLEEVTIASKGYKYLPLAAADTFIVRATTPDVTVNGFRIDYVWILNTGGTTYSTSTTSSTVTGGASYAGEIIGTGTAPANAIGIYEYIINNLIAPTAQSRGVISTTVTLAALPGYYPLGSSNLEDLNLLLDHADDVRPVGLRATATYIGEKLENGWVVGGPMPMPGDAIAPQPTLADVGTTLGMLPRALNSEAPGLSFPILPMTKQSTDYHSLEDLYDARDFGEGIILFQATSALADVVILQTEMSLQARTERQTMMVTPGPVSLPAISEVFTFLASINPLDLVSGNDDHDVKAAEVRETYAESHPTYNILPGWFSGNSLNVQDSNIAV
jgi:hypothetical protein